MKKQLLIGLLGLFTYWYTTDPKPTDTSSEKLELAPVIDADYHIPDPYWWQGWPCKRRNDNLEARCQPNTIRDQVITIIHPHNAGSLNMGQISDVFNYFKKRWTYIQDPLNEEYFDSAEHALRTLRGDCDDYAIALATSLRSIGAFCRIVGAYNTAQGTGHAYAQVCLGNTNLIAVEQYLRKRYHIKDPDFEFAIQVDQWGNRWLNLDPLSPHPGGALFQADTGFKFLLGHPDICIDSP